MDLEGGWPGVQRTRVGHLEGLMASGGMVGNSTCTQKHTCAVPCWGWGGAADVIEYRDALFCLSWSSCGLCVNVNC